MCPLPTGSLASRQASDPDRGRWFEEEQHESAIPDDSRPHGRRVNGPGRTALAVVPQQAPPVTYQDPGAEPWVAAWTTAPQGVYPLGYAVGQPGPLGEVAPGVEQPLLEHAFPDEQAQDQTLRMVVHPGHRR